MAEFPLVRLRRLRRNEPMRRLVRETRIDASDLVYPVFVVYGEGVKNEVSSMPGVFQLSVDMLPAEMVEISSLGIGAVILFGIPETKDEAGSGAFDAEGVIQKAVKTIKSVTPDMIVITDV